MKYLIRFVVLVIWIGSVGWLVRYEAYPEYFTHRLNGYKSIISKDILLIDSWMRILVDNSPVGYSYTKMKVEKSDKINHYKIENFLTFSINIAGVNQHINIKSNSVLNNIYQLQKFKFSIISKFYSIKINGEKLEKNIFKITRITKDTKQIQKIEIPEDLVIYSPMTEMAMKSLKPGQTMSISTFDPITMSKINIIFKGIKKEKIIIGKKEYDTILIIADMKGAIAKLWIDSLTGQPLRQTTPFGWTMEKSTSRLALQSINKAGTNKDILKNLAVKPFGIPLDPKVDKLIIKLTGVEFKDLEFASDRQKILTRKDKEIEMLITKQTNNKFFRKNLLSIQKQAPFLRSTLAVQSDNPEIIKTCKTIINNIQNKNNRIKVQAVFNWVYKNMKKEITISLPSALDVLHTMKGDCNEHAYLFTALVRALKIPAKIITGLVFTKGRFYYHAWTSVYIDGQWIEMDPTWGQPFVDVTHIAVVTGEISDQFQLVKLMGNLKIEIKEVPHDKD